ncbi:MAG TPA: hypothetical protein VGR87_13395 [Candidatus Limnocylindria bacterium]|nr:hypothetical protein [Candidatus Limnocylindria bacterium]
MVVVLRDIDRAAVRALAYAESLDSALTVLQLASGEEGRRARRLLRRLGLARDAEFLELDASKDPVEQVVDYVEATARERPNGTIAVVLSEVVPGWPWLLPLHDQTPRRLKQRLREREKLVVIDVPYHV